MAWQGLPGRTTWQSVTYPCHISKARGRFVITPQLWLRSRSKHAHRALSRCLQAWRRVRWQPQCLPSPCILLLTLLLPTISLCLQAMAAAEVATTVSPTYAEEVSGHPAIAPHHGGF